MARTILRTAVSGLKCSHCGKGHSWWTTPAKVKERTWRPECARLNKITNLKQLSGHLRGAAATHHTPET